MPMTLQEQDVLIVYGLDRKQLPQSSVESVDGYEHLTLGRRTAQTFSRPLRQWDADLRNGQRNPSPNMMSLPSRSI